MEHKVILASKSPARLGVLKSAGITPKIAVSNFDEDKFLETLAYKRNTDTFAPELEVTALALKKATEVLKQLCQENSCGTEKILVACDSMLEFNGKMLGKPHTRQVAYTRALQTNNKVTTLHTGYAIVKLSPWKITEKDIDSLDIDTNISNWTDLQNCAKNLPFEVELICESTKVKFSHLSEYEITRYIDTKEPLGVAGGFTVDGYGSAFIEEVVGDYNNVIGISPRVIRKACQKMGIEYCDLWD